MIIKSFSAVNFRNIEEEKIEFSRGVNLLVGKNAEGKTNALEGIYLFSRGKSFRAREEKELIMSGSEGFRLKIEYEDKTGENSLEYAVFGKERQRRKNGYKISRVGEMIGSFVSVLFSPDDLSLVKGGPEERRQLLNIGVSQCYGEYISYYSDFKRCLDNKNKLLRSASHGEYYDIEELRSWSYTMAGYAARIHSLRVKYIDILKKHAGVFVRELSEGKEELDLYYKSDIKPEENKVEIIEALYREKFTQNLEKEIIVGSSLYGPQRDDMEIMISGKSARSYASQGQQRSVVLALKLAEGEAIREIFGEYPVYLFDDVLSELDIGRREYLIKGIKGKQIIITSCFLEDINDFADRVIEVKNGSYVPSYR